MKRSKTLAAGLLVATMWVSGCKSRDEAPRPAALGPSGSPAPTAPAVPAAAPAAPPAPAAPAPAPAAAAPAAPAGPAQTITGKITLSDKRKADVTPTDVVYLVARRVEANPAVRGALVAVKKFTASSFPIEFTLGPSDMMFQNGPFEGELTLAVRVDKDGDPMTRRKGDVFGTLDKVKVGAKGVEVKLTELQKADESLAGPPPMMNGSNHP